MSSIDAKSIVSQGLERRSEARIRRDEELENQARKLQQTINNNHTARTLADAHKWERAKAKRKEMEKVRKEKENASILAIHYYIRACICIILTTLFTPFPWWAAIALIAGLAVFPAAYIYRLEVRS